MKHLNFVKYFTRIIVALLLFGSYACRQATKDEKKEEIETVEVKENLEPFFKLSLAQWSINRMIRNDGVDPYTFAEKAKAWGFTGLEYVSQLYRAELEAENYSAEAMQNFVDKNNAAAKKHGLTNLLIMIDGEGPLASTDSNERAAAVKNHYKWVDAAAAMGCHSIRVNLQGTMESEAWVEASVDGLTQLATYAKEKNVNVIVENHGGPSSNASWLASVMQKVNMDNCGTLPDFGNFCVKREDGSYYESKCLEEYDKYLGVTQLMPYAKAVSAKAYDFDEGGNEAEIDYIKMMRIVKEAGYTGYVGVEYEGNELGEEAGIIATRDLLLKVQEQLK
ncbi:sugar phosphate isomerase/epimerase family protein [uncultured Croceitalea sp.]|uniref:sugar phosphate isomerase/epimerase family protein n=1 Tax=uncultured Croceitalea sp. TaxID=1798908 RepID=UPI003305C7D8